jgi:hypothetical protein
MNGSAVKTAATWLFVLPFSTAGIAQDSAKIEVAGLAALAFTAFVVFRLPVPAKAVYRIGLTAAVLALTICAYLISGAWPSSYGTAGSYDTQAVIFAITYLAVAAFTVLFFDERLFERVIWRAVTVALWIAVLSCLASRLTHELLLVSESHGALRMQGTLSEPSAWAPLLPVIVLLAIQRRSWPYLALAAAGAVLAASPTCILVLLATVPAHYVLTGTRRQRVAVLLALAACVPAAVFFVQTANPRLYLDSHSTAEVAVGRLLSGIQNVETGGRAGHNTRMASTRVVIAEARANGWLLTGAGPAADSTYFPAKFPADSRLRFSGTNSLLVSVLFDFGAPGVAVLGSLMLAAVWRMRRRPEMSAILLPFFAASLINSAEGPFEYAFVALGIMVFTFGWAGPATR